MTHDELAAVVEAIVMTSKDPVTVRQIAGALEAEGVSADEIERALAHLREECDDQHRGIRLERVAGGWRAVTAPGVAPYLKAFDGAASQQRLSQAALEVLAIVAYRQPVTLPEINFLRGVNSAGVVRTLVERKLLKVAGRKKVVGKPFLYRTTREFLVHFGLDRPEDLPDLDELVSDPSLVAGEES